MSKRKRLRKFAVRLRWLGWTVYGYSQRHYTHTILASDETSAKRKVKPHLRLLFDYEVDDNEGTIHLPFDYCDIDCLEVVSVRPV